MNNRQKAERVLASQGHAAITLNILNDADIKKLATHCNKDGELTGDYTDTCLSVVRDAYDRLKATSDTTDEPEKDKE